MIRPSKYLILFTSVSAILGIAVFISSQKFLPILLQHTVYYCQSVLDSFSIHIPNGLGTLLTGLLLLVVSFTIAKFIITYGKVVFFRKKLHSKVQENRKFNQVTEKLDLSNRAYLVEDEKPFAFCHGIRHPKIYLSTALLLMVNVSELEAILLHEKYHLEHKDSFIMFLAELTKSLFPFFPLLSDLMLNFRIERELAADHEATQKLGNSASLISVLKKLLTIEPVQHYAFAAALADHETLEIRIKTLMKKGTYFMKFRPLNLLASALSIAVFVVLIVAPVQAIEMRDKESDVMMICLQSDSCAIWCKENQTVIPNSKIPNASYPSSPLTPDMSSTKQLY